MKEREVVYDERIAPLMTTIIKVCQKYNISMLASFRLNDEPGGDYFGCTTYLPNKEQPCDVLEKAKRIIYDDIT